MAATDTITIQKCIHTKCFWSLRAYIHTLVQTALRIC